MGVEASVVVEFGDSVTSSMDETVNIELDDTHDNNLNADGEIKSNFLPGEQPVFILNHSSDLIISDIRCTDGNIIEMGSDLNRSRDTEVLFTTIDTEEALSYAGVETININWWGNAGSILISNSVLTLDSGTIPCAGDVSFDVNFQRQYMLIPPTLNLIADEVYKIIIVVYMEAA